VAGDRRPANAGAASLGGADGVLESEEGAAGPVDAAAWGATDDAAEGASPSVSSWGGAARLLRSCAAARAMFTPKAMSFVSLARDVF